MRENSISSTLSENQAKSDLDNGNAPVILISQAVPQNAHHSHKPSANIVIKEEFHSVSGSKKSKHSGGVDGT
jgi:hypothetical protein